MVYVRKSQIFLRLHADVFMCERRKTGSGLVFWNLRLLSDGQLVDGFHWENKQYPQLLYRAGDSITVFGRWSSPQKKRLQVLWSSIGSSHAANDDLYDTNEPSSADPRPPVRLTPKTGGQNES